MIRTPSLPIKYLLQFAESNMDIYNYIKNDAFLDDFIKKALYLSSKSLYNAYISEDGNSKKYTNLCTGLLKYFIRAASRPTPFGYFADISLGEFGDRTELIKSKQYLDISLDIDWVNKYIESIENDFSFLEQLQLKYNNICFVSGDRLKNPYYSFRGNIADSDDFITEINIRYTNLIKIIQLNTQKFINYKKLANILKEYYVGIDDKIIHETLKNLVENEILITNLRLPAYYKNSLSHIENIISNLKGADEINIALIKIKKMLRQYQMCQDHNLLKEIDSIMTYLHPSKDYLSLNLGMIYRKAYLSKEIKKKVEKFTNSLDVLMFENDEYMILEKFKLRFLECYGKKIEVDLTEIIDSNKFNGLFLIDTEKAMKNGERERKIKQIIHQKIDMAIYEKQNVYLRKEDFVNIKKNNTKFPVGFDLNFYITQSEQKLNYIIGPNVGSSRAGAMFHRFSDCLNKKTYQNYNNKLFQTLNNNKNYIEVELRENNLSGKGANIINNNKNSLYYFPIGVFENEDNNISLQDILIGMDNNNNFYLKSKKMNKKIRFVKNNMLNIKINSKIFQLLYLLSETYEDKIIERFLTGNYNKIFIPRMYYEGVIICLRQWNFDSNLLNVSSFEYFKNDFIEMQRIYCIERMFYLIEKDNRLIIDSNNENQLKLLYNFFKKHTYITISELEPGLLDNTLVQDINYNNYISELVFTFTRLDIYKETISENKLDEIADNSLHLKIINVNRVMQFCQNGWIYIKIYGLENRTDEFISKNITELLKELDNPHFFYIRYIDDIGKHIRLRLKLRDEKECYNKLYIINKWVQGLKDRGISSKVLYDEYVREINRYGGAGLIEACEEIFFKDSMLCVNLLNDNIDYEREYIFSILNILKESIENLEQIFTFLDRKEFKNLYREDYKKDRKKYIKLGESILAGDSLEFSTYEALVVQRALSIKVLVNKYKNEEKFLTNSFENIVASLIHMHCNRLNGDNSLELKYFVICRHIVHDIYQRRKNNEFKHGGSERT